ncbi:MAG: sigma-70 family RNA polymerase sigma factor [Candidatus Colwellbacteria bacterium]|jgi:RNA polymerase sigma-70 factor (ECF subfamily)|nr:sigma-70 family RNA polymerase sigma factor [Candidatus Colwellbacteria bacterium]MCK9497354.1 sigma-70 family RNA polymerase sigma factor [Candidatus Colwellbacteria bacterium]MDD3752706.1 sigma-70 family RNA polymerase sigma factor [Candidatus Colwellbacteria bacterium]MDD4818752.1 sigma-70 family RNA polymerase sigma factor [Candidatus Colwellbacteria bacterium]
MLEDEQKLVVEAKGGKTEAFGQLYDYYLPMIYRFILIKIGHREEAEDLTHQVFLKAWQNISSYTEQGFPFSSWLYRIARNSIIDHYRKSKPSINIDKLANIEELTFRPNIKKLDDKKNIAKVMKCLDDLKDMEKDVVILRFIEEMSVKETAESIGKTEGATKVIQHRALKKLKDILGQEE